VSNKRLTDLEMASVVIIKTVRAAGPVAAVLWMKTSIVALPWLAWFPAQLAARTV